jgi:hypothetical protein
MRKLTRTNVTEVTEFINIVASVPNVHGPGPGVASNIHWHIEKWVCLFRFDRLGYRSSTLMVNTCWQESEEKKKNSEGNEHSGSGCRWHELNVKTYLL